MSDQFTRRTLVKGIAASSVVTLAGCPGAPIDRGPTETPSEDDPGPSPPDDDDSDPQPVFQLEEYPRMRVASLDEIGTEPLSFEYPLEDQTNFVVKLGEHANGGVGPDDDVVAFNYACSHMGCSLEGTYKEEHGMLGACPCHLSRFDLANYGMVVDGVATQSLPMIVLDIDEEDDVYATGVMGLLYGYRDNLKDGEPSQAVKEALGVADGTGGGGNGGGDDEGEGDGGADDASGVGFGGWFEDVSNFEGVADETDASEVSVAVGAQGNQGNFAFDPPAVRVSAGTTVTWEWTGEGGQHNVKAEDGGFESELTSEAGFTFEYTFEETGTVRYVCTPHRSLGMKGAVVVGAD